LSHATATGNTLAPDPGAQDHGVAPGDAADNLNHVDHGTVWDHLFPPPITTPRLAIGAALTSQSAENTPRSVEPGPSRPRGQHRSYPYSASAPLTPNPAYGANGSQDQFFAHLAGSMFLSQQHTGDSDGGREAVGLPTVPAPQGHNPAPPDLERIGSRKPRLDNREWSPFACQAECGRQTGTGGVAVVGCSVSYRTWLSDTNPRSWVVPYPAFQRGLGNSFRFPILCGLMDDDCS